MSMSPLELLDWRFSESPPPRLPTFSLLSSSRSSESDLFLRRRPGSLCVGTWKLEKEPPNDGLFSENKNGNQTLVVGKPGEDNRTVCKSCIPTLLDVLIFDSRI